MTDATERTDAPRPGTHHPHLARERALKVLFQADIRGVDPRVLLAQIERQRGALSLLDELEPDAEQVAGDEALQVELTRRRRMPLDDYTRTLIEGVAVHLASIDALLGEVAKRWSVKRMPAVDRNLLRLAVYELAEQDTPPIVVIDEAVSLAGGFAGEKARPFINGILETVRKAIVNGDVQLTPEVLAPAVGVATIAAATDGITAPLDDVDASPMFEEDPATGIAWGAALDLLADLEPDDDEYAPLPSAVTDEDVDEYEDAYQDEVAVEDQPVAQVEAPAVEQVAPRETPDVQAAFAPAVERAADPDSEESAIATDRVERASVSDTLGQLIADRIGVTGVEEDADDEDLDDVNIADHADHADDDDDDDEDGDGEVDSLDGDGLFAAFGADADSPREDEDEDQGTLW
jgi:N utilization substance protein B